MIVRFSPAFKRAYKKLLSSRPELSERTDQKIRLFGTDPRHPSLQTHKLSGSMKHMWSFSVDHDIRVVFAFQEDGTVLLESIGTHDEVY